MSEQRVFAAADAKVQVSRDLSLIAPKFRAAVEAAIAECNAAGFDAWVYEAFRTQELQTVYYNRGVSKAKSVLYSWHGYGLAVDVISKANGWDVSSEWLEGVARIFKSHGLHWGGDWVSFKGDDPHFQWHCDGMNETPSNHARELMANGGKEAVWSAVHAS